MTGIIAVLGDSRDILKTYEENSFDSCVTDPPYALVSTLKRFGKENGNNRQVPKKGHQYQRLSRGFMGQQWDTGETAFDPTFWAEVYRTLKPGAHLVAFSGTRTYHRMAVAIEDAGFEIRDQLAWAYGSGFPKSHDVSKGIDKTLGRERTKVRVDAAKVRNPKVTGAGRDGTEGASRPWIESAMERGFHEAVSDEAVEWQGWGTALKPAWEPICLARKPLSEKSVAANVLRWGTGAINISECRVDSERAPGWAGAGAGGDTWNETNNGLGKDGAPRPVQGRWPANIVHDGSDEVISAFPDSDGQQGDLRGSEPSKPTDQIYGQFAGRVAQTARNDSGSAARFFYTAKADADDRLGSGHPTVKPVDLMQWLCRLITPPGGLILEPFAGTGTTGEAAFREKFRCTMIEREEKFYADILRRIDLMQSGADTRRRESIKAKIESGRLKDDPGPLFGDK